MVLSDAFLTGVLVNHLFVTHDYHLGRLLFRPVDTL